MEPYVAAIFFLASLTQAVTGFGSAMVPMSLLPILMPVETAAPLVTLASATLELILLYRFRGSIRIAAVWRLALAALIGVPLGALGLSKVPSRYILGGLGCILVAYSLYGLLLPKLPQTKNPLWAYVAGFVSGVLGGAYNTSGAPIIVYGSTQTWSSDEFRGNLQGFYLLVDAAVLIGRVWQGQFTRRVIELSPWALVPLLVGIGVGAVLERRIRPAVFRRLVLGLLLLMGGRLLFMALRS